MLKVKKNTNISLLNELKYGKFEITNLKNGRTWNLEMQDIRTT